MIVIARTPLRISFFGGGTDLPEFSSLYGGEVVSTAIDKYLYVGLRTRQDSLITLDSPFGHEQVGKISDLRHNLIKTVLKAFTWDTGLSIWIVSDVAATGCGLGSSSALIVGLLHALLKMSGKKDMLCSRPSLANFAAQIEQQLGDHGVQDAYGSVYGGCNHLSFHTDGSVNIKPFPQFGLQEKLMLFNVGISRSSRIVQSHKKSTTTLLEIKNLAHRFLAERHPERVFSSYLKDTWSLKRSVSPAISSPYLDDIYRQALAAGASSGKLLGAGGGGHFLFYVEKDKREPVKQKLLGSGVTQVPFLFENRGSTIMCEAKEES